MNVTDLINTSRRLLDAGQTAEADTCLRAALRLSPACLEAHNLIETHRLGSALGPAFGIDAHIHPDDEIFRFFAGHPSSINPIRDYLADGWRTLSELLRLFEQLDRKLSTTSSFLEFASGFGRFTRHLKASLPADSLHVSDIVPGSVDFLRQQFGLDGVYSRPEPEALELPRRYQVIFVLSLFSHLPDGLWQRWLQRLYDALEPGGHLILTTHGEEFCARHGVTLPANGYHFIPSSESITLDASLYGSTFTAPLYVQNAIRQLPETPQNVLHVPAHFWNLQDAWILQRPA